MSLKEIGFTLKKAEVRELTIAELKLSILRNYVIHGVREVRLVCLSTGEVDVFKSLEDIAKNDWAGNCKIELINMPFKYGFLEEGDYYNVIVYQFAEEENDKFI